MYVSVCLSELKISYDFITPKKKDYKELFGQWARCQMRLRVKLHALNVLHKLNT